MRNFLKAFLILSLALTITGCSSGKAMDKSRLVALEWAEAELQWDGNQRMELLTPQAKEKYKHSQHTHGEAVSPEKKISDYELTEWKIDDDTYIYKIVYPDGMEFDTTWTKLERTETGWGVPTITFSSFDADKYIKGIEPTVIKELGK